LASKSNGQILEWAMRLPHHMCRVSVLLAALLVASLLSPLPATAAPGTITVVSISLNAANPIAPGTPFSWTVTFSAPIDPFTVDPSGFTVFYDDGTPGNPTGGLVPIISATPDPSGLSITVVPTPRSDIGTYTLTVVGPLSGLDGSSVTGLPVSGGVYTMAITGVVWVGSTADGAPRPAPNCADMATSDCTLREAIATANSGQDRIRFRPTVTGAITLDQAQGTLSLTQSVAIIGPGATVLAVDGAGLIGIFHVFGTPTIALSGLTIRHGNVVGESYGGALAIEGGDITLSADAFTSNTAGGAGGAIASRGGAILRVTSSTFTGNQSTGNNGGAIDSAFPGVQLVVTDSTFTDNTAPMGNGGAINNYQGVATLTNVTLANNGSDDSVASYADAGLPATTNLTNVVIANAGNGAADLLSIGGGTFTGSNNLTDDSSGSLITGGTGTITGQPALLGTLGDYGGLTQTVPLLPGSPAIDAGSCAAGYHDQRGIAQVGAACDIGAFESRGFTLAISGGNVQSIPVGTPFPLPLAVTMAAKSIGEPVQGGQVTYTVSPVGGAAATLSANTAAIGGGDASVTATANSVPGGPYGVVASATGAQSLAFSLMNTNPLTGIAVTGPTSGTMKVGETAQFHATATYSDGSHSDITSTVTWNASSPTIASVDSTGSVTAKAPGPVTITASIASPAGIRTQTPLQGQVPVTIVQPTLTGVQPGPAPASRPSGATLPGGTPKPAPAPLPPMR
jgi:CSLREA domain-containing protein